MAQALADRFVEAFAEYLHRQIRIDLWGYAKDEKLDEADLLKIKYDGIRPAPGYPSQPDHTEKSTMWDVVKVKELSGIELSESLSMMPAASVSASGSPAAGLAVLPPRRTRSPLLAPSQAGRRLPRTAS